MAFSKIFLCFIISKCKILNFQCKWYTINYLSCWRCVILYTMSCIILQRSCTVVGYMSYYTFISYSNFAPFAHLCAPSSVTLTHMVFFGVFSLCAVEKGWTEGSPSRESAWEMNTEQFYTSKNKTFDRILCLRQRPLWFNPHTQTFTHALWDGVL